MATCSPPPRTPALSVAAAASTPPEYTGVPSNSPVRLAPSRCSRPATWAGDTRSWGSRFGSIPSAASISKDQLRRPMSKTPPRLPAAE